MNKGEIPIGFGMTLAQNPKAMEKFAKMSEKEQENILSQIHNINSKRRNAEICFSPRLKTARFFLYVPDLTIPFHIGLILYILYNQRLC